MATLVLTALGTALGGPVGGAIGAIIGQQIDQSIFGTNTQGPRLTDLSVQTASYGTKIPRLYGAYRTSGTVIWATDLKEASSTSGPKGSSTTTYTYSASFAVQLSARPIHAIGRIWADGNLLRGAAGDWKEQLTSFTLYTGSETQTADPFMASAQGAAKTPAYRGAAYCVFEDLQLIDFGNRIPSLSFEVFADGGPVTLQAMVSDMAGPDAALNTLAPASFAGFSAEEASIGDAITTLTNAVPLRVWDDGVTLQMAQAVLTTTSVADNDLGTTADKAKPVKLAVTRKSASTIPQSLWIAYYDSARDYQKNTQTARRVAGARKGQSLNLPATLDAATAKTIAETKLSTIWAERATARLALPWRYLALEPGQTLLVPGSTDDWRISAITFNKMVLEVDLTRQLPASSLSYSASAGQVVTQFDAPAGPTALDLLDLPLLTDGVASAPFVAAAAAGASVGWSGVALSISTDGGASFTNAGTIGAASVLGVANSALPTSSAYLIDTQNSVTVQLLNTQMLLTDASDTLLLGGANAAMLGNELIQFGSAQPLGGGLWQLSRLLRGRRGTEFAISSHMVGDNFALLNPASMVQLPVPLGTADLKVTAQGIGDGPSPPLVDLPNPGIALRPLSPVYLIAARQPNGDVIFNWIRRSRNGWNWLDGVDAPLGEESEAYALTLSPSGGSPRTATANSPAYTYTAAQYAADKAAGATTMTISVAQTGTYATSLPTSLTLPLT